MSILVDENTRIVFQGFTGDKASFHAKEAIEYGTNIVAGVTPGKGGATHLGLPVYDTVKEAVKATGATASGIFVPAPFCADAIMEAADAEIQLIVCITDGIPAQDMMRVKRYMLRYSRERKPTLIGPNCAGVISTGKAMIGIMPGSIYTKGRVGIGGDPINGSSFVDMLQRFEADDETDAVMMIGEIGGPQEAEASLWARDNMSKPIVGYVAGLSAPRGRRMGHAGAIISAFGDSALEKAEIMRNSGLTVAASPAELGSAMKQALLKPARRPVLA